MSYGKEIVPPRKYVPVTPGATDLSAVCRGLYFGDDGTVTATMIDGDVVTDMPVQAGLLVGYFARVSACSVDVWAVY